MVEAKQYLGVTEPLNVSSPIPMDLKSTDELIRILKNNHAYESEFVTAKRNKFLIYFEKEVRDLIRGLCERKNMSEEECRNAGGKVVTYGSFHLGVHSRESDIDTLCVIPSLISREEFFGLVAHRLKGNLKVKKLNVVYDSFVPVIKFIYDNISIDLVCARLDRKSIPLDLDINDTNLLSNIDQYSVRSINGHRVSNDILRLVPNVDTFRTSVRCIKLWASRKNISSNVLGFLGGIAWALLVARICQLYPNACASIIVSKFFHIYVNWNWPSPVLLRHIEDGPLLPTNIKPWNPRTSLHDRAHRMPVITPAYPSMCATHNVTESTFRIIMSEMKRAGVVVNSILDNNTSWDTLFTADTFFSTYRHYLQIVVSGDHPDTVNGWSGCVESKIRLLITKLEMHKDVQLAHPYPKGYSHQYSCANKPALVIANHGQCPPHQMNTTTNDEGFVSLSGIAYTKIFYVGLYISPDDGRSNQVDLYRPISEFLILSRAWNLYDKKHMGLVVQLLNSSELPTDVV